MNKQLDDFLRNDASEMQKNKERPRDDSLANLTTINEHNSNPTEKRRRP